MAVLLAQRPKKFYQRGELACRKCATPIHVHKLSTLPEEFSLRCPKCGDRAIYLKRAVAIQELPERRKKPRK
jgi:Zn finger protein HypA/HybF involved in hydrogenase expression